MLVACSVSNSTRANEDNARRITKGMTEAQVRAILGEPAESISQTVPPGHGIDLTYTVWTYKGKNQIGVVFENGQVTAVKIDDRQIVRP
jgi:outer membrane protein assembly factor BamE (lipoprotein component of BamABCDE complex)